MTLQFGCYYLSSPAFTTVRQYEWRHRYRDDIRSFESAVRFFVIFILRSNTLDDVPVDGRYMVRLDKSLPDGSQEIAIKAINLKILISLLRNDFIAVGSKTREIISIS